MEDPERRRAPSRIAPGDELVLAALDRAVRHGPAHAVGAALREVLEHLAVPRRSSTARAAAERLAELERAGAVERVRAHGVSVWTLTRAGRRRLEAAARKGRLEGLPESPQHRAWRRARLAASEELARFAAELASDLAVAEEMLAGLAPDRPAPHSDAWLALGSRLLGDCRRLGSAWHCLREWPEPDDDAPDRDEDARAAGPALRALRAGRRNIALWRDDVAAGD